MMYNWSQTIRDGIVRQEADEVKVYEQRPSDLVELLQQSAKRFPHKTALIDEDMCVSYSALERMTTLQAKYLIARLGIRKGDRVVLLMKNTACFCLATYSVIKAGAIVVPFNTKLKPNEWQVLIEETKPALFIVEDELLSRIKPLIQDGTPVILESEWLQDKEIRHSSDHDLTSLANVDEHDPAFILFTSGTTGAPKGAVLSHFNVIHACINYERCYGLLPTDTTIIAVPIFHGTGLFAQFFPFVYVGGTVVLQKKFHAETMLALCEKHQVTHTIVVPTIYTMLLHTPGHRAFRLAFRIMGSGGAPLPEVTAKRLKQWMPDVKLINTYGLTEATSPAVIMPSEKEQDKPGSIGIPSPVMDCKIVDPQTGAECASNQTGELWLRGPLIMQGYWQNEEVTERALAAGWLKTGDVARRDEEGFLYIQDRIKEMINRGGEKVYSIEVENVLFNHPQIFEAAIVGVPDQLYGEEVKAVVVPKSGEQLDEGEIRAWCGQFLANYKVPKYVEIVESLPRNPGGKVQKKELVQQKMLEIVREDV